jgi:hypothetical protein
LFESFVIRVKIKSVGSKMSVRKLAALFEQPKENRNMLPNLSRKEEMEILEQQALVKSGAISFVNPHSCLKNHKASSENVLAVENGSVLKKADQFETPQVEVAECKTPFDELKLSGFIRDQISLFEEKNTNLFQLPQDRPTIMCSMTVSSTVDRWELASQMKEFKETSKEEFRLKESRSMELKKLISNSTGSRTLIEQVEMKFDERNKARDDRLKLGVKIAKAAFQEFGTDISITDKAAESNLTVLGSQPTGFVKLDFRVSEEFSSTEFETLEASEELQAELELRLRDVIAVELGCDMQELALVGFVKGSVWASMGATKEFFEKAYANLKEKSRQLKVDLKKCVPDRLLKIQSPNHVEMVEIVSSYLKYRMEELKIASNLSSQTVKMTTVLKLSVSDFDPRGDFKFPRKGGETQKRGGQTYLQPSSDWERIGLRVMDLYPDGNDWLAMDGREGEWAVAFHGTSSNIEAIRSILQVRGVLPGYANAYGGSKAANRTDSVIPSPGIYLSQNVETCYNNPVEIDGEKYQIAFQCRVHPDYIWETGNSSGWIVVDAPHHVRPYGIVLKKISGPNTVAATSAVNTNTSAFSQSTNTAASSFSQVQKNTVGDVAAVVNSLCKTSVPHWDVLEMFDESGVAYAAMRWGIAGHCGGLLLSSQDVNCIPQRAVKAFSSVGLQR